MCKFKNIQLQHCKVQHLNKPCNKNRSKLPRSILSNFVFHFLRQILMIIESSIGEGVYLTSIRVASGKTHEQVIHQKHAKGNVQRIENC